MNKMISTYSFNFIEMLRIIFFWNVNSGFTQAFRPLVIYSNKCDIKKITTRKALTNYFVILICYRTVGTQTCQAEDICRLGLMRLDLD